MEAEAVDDLVDRLALGAQRESDEVELVGRNVGHSGPIRFVVTRLEQLVRVDRGVTPRLIARS